MTSAAYTGVLSEASPQTCASICLSCCLLLTSYLSHYNMTAHDLGVRISCSPLLIFLRPPLCWFKFLFSIQFHLLNFRSFFTFFSLHIHIFYGIIIQKMIEYSIYYKQVVSPCQEKNVKICCIFQIEYSQIPLHIVTAR